MTKKMSVSDNTIGIYTRYTETGASSRLRYYLYREPLESAGFRPVFHPLFSDNYLKQLYSGRGKSKSEICIALLRRAAEMFSLEDRLLIEYELLPLMPAFTELLLIGRKKFVLNFDDLVWEKYKNLPLLENKFDRLISKASGVIAANHLLFDKTSRLNDNVMLLPTVIDLAGYQPARVKKTEKLRAAWIGTPVTYRECFLPFTDIFRRLCQELPLEILVIAKKDLPVPDGLNIHCVDWQQETEAQLLSTCDIGVMPLVNNDFSRGKSAYKLIQYAATGLPAIASPVGENRYFIRNGENGFAAETADDWSYAVKQLTDWNLRNTMSQNMLKQAYEYSIQKFAPQLIDFLNHSFSG